MKKRFREGYQAPCMEVMRLETYHLLETVSIENADLVGDVEQYEG